MSPKVSTHYRPPLLIWKHAAAAPTILRLDKDGAVYFESGLLTACTASRAAFLQFPGTVRSLYGWGAAKKVGSSDFDCDYTQRPRSAKPGVWWRPQLDLVVLGRGINRDDLGRIAGADQIRHLAIHYDDAFASSLDGPFLVSLSTNERWGEWLTTILPNLRTWEIYAEWIESLDQQRAAGDGRSTSSRDIIFIPRLRNLRWAMVSQLLMELRGEEVLGYRERRPDLKLLGRPIFHVGRAQLNLDP
ncbi:uncharacterized protein PG986_004201 [Apiospora aurea]|uniref:Uncharacterized protein n=1 Tax=Apiospora aurea TaxID=335848 RepID=A0ABR1QLX2_9PEZI